MSFSSIKLHAFADNAGSEMTEKAADDQVTREFKSKENKFNMLTFNNHSEAIMNETQTFSDEGAIHDSEAPHFLALTPFLNTQKSTEPLLQAKDLTAFITVLQMHATERLYTNIHNHYMTPEESFEGSTSVRLYDKALSEHHANIIYRDSKRSYFTFLLCQQKITNNTSRSKKFPVEIHLLILRYLGENTSYFIQDNGSKTGTYEKVSPKLSVSLKNDQEFQLSMDTTIKILQTENKPKIAKFEASKRNRNMIKKFMKDGDVKIIGLEQEFSTKLTSELPSFRKNNSKDTRNLDWNSHFTFDISFLKLEVHEQRENKISKYLIFPMDGSFDYFIGRNECSDIFLSSPTCSRRHCKITFNEARRTWNIIDGAEGLPSLGGTWKSLQTIAEKAEKKPSKEMPINSGSKFRLGDNVYEFLYTKKKVKFE